MHFTIDGIQQRLSGFWSDSRILVVGGEGVPDAERTGRGKHCNTWHMQLDWTADIGGLHMCFRAVRLMWYKALMGPSR